MDKTGICVALLAMLLGAGGCESSNTTSADTARETGIAFVEGSTGLPATGQWRQGLAFHDMNGDGHLDILATPQRTAPAGERTPAIWYGDGQGEWTRSHLDVPHIGYDYGDIAVADFDADGTADMGLAMHTKGLSVLKGQEGGAFVEASTGLPPYSEFPTRALAASDFNSDGIPEVVAFREYTEQGSRGSPYGGLVWCVYKKGAWTCQNIGNKAITDGLIGDIIAVGDVDGDGHKDLAVSSFNHRITRIVWLGNGKGEFEPFNTGLMQEKHYNSVALADVNQDGRDDLVASVSSFAGEFKGIKVFISGPDGFSDLSEGLPSGEDSWGYFASAGDLNGDGAPEIVVAPKPGGLKVYALKGDQWHEVKAAGLPDTDLYRVYNLYIMDFNEDDKKDIAVIYADAKDGSGGIRVFLNTSEDTSRK